MVKLKLLRIKPSVSLESKKIKALLKFLPEEIKLLVETYKFASEVYAEIGLLYTWGEIFRLLASSIEKSESGLCHISLYRSSRYGTRGEGWFFHYLPDELAERLLALSQLNHGGTLFQQQNGKVFNHSCLKTAFRKASRIALRAGSIKKVITPIELRSTPPSEITFQPGFHREVSEEKITQIRKIIPSCYRNAGCYGKHSLKMLCKILLAAEDFRYSRKELCLKFPAARAAESKKRDWIKKCIWPQIRKILIV